MSTSKLYLASLLVLLSLKGVAQNVGINNTGTAPDASAALDLNSGTSNNRGFLPQMVALTATNTAGPITNPSTALLVYNTATSGVAPFNVIPGYYYNAGTPVAPNWVWFAAGNGTTGAWNLQGNSGTVDGTNFIGTLDNVPFNIRVNNLKAGRIDNTLSNTFLGFQAGNTVTGNGNSGLGQKALFSLTSGIHNTAVGVNSLYMNATSSSSTALGYAALYSNTTGEHNLALGDSALSTNTTGSGNSAAGYMALSLNSTGSFNTAFGDSAMVVNTSGYDNTAVGAGALLNNNGARNTAIGTHALFYNNTGANNSGLGEYSLVFNSSGMNNTATGLQVMFTNTTGSNNTAAGVNALYYNVSGSNNTSTGVLSLDINTASNNCAYGYQALYANTSGMTNTAMGYEAMINNLTGSANTAVGDSTLGGNTTGSYNNASGFKSLLTNTSGAYNNAYGGGALLNNFTGSQNTAVGHIALLTNVSGNFNTAVGYGADVTLGIFNNATAIGANASVCASNTMTFGDGNVTGWGFGTCVAGGDLMTINGGGGTFAKLSTGGVWSWTSDRNKKENFKVIEGEELLNKIDQLRITQWNYKVEPNVRHIGPMAQDFYKAFKLSDDSLSISSLDPSGISLAGIQALNKKLEEKNRLLQDQINKLEASNAALDSARLRNEKSIAELRVLYESLTQPQANSTK